jgi:hypothetical protein
MIKTIKCELESKTKIAWQVPVIKEINIRKTLATSGLPTDSGAPAGTQA